MKIAIIGAGWSGLSCAIELVKMGHQVRVFEASPLIGGRAKSVECKGLAGNQQALTKNAVLDNGQHILIGAYRSCIGLMHTLGLPIDQLFYRQTLAMNYPNGNGIRFPNLNSPWNALFGILTAKGWSFKDKLSLLWVTSRWQISQFKCAPNSSVKDLCKGTTAKVLNELLEPICISALNISASQADGQLFLNVIKDTLFAGLGASDFLIPYGDLSDTFAKPAEHWLTQHNCEVLTHRRIIRLEPLSHLGQLHWKLHFANTLEATDLLPLQSEIYDHVVLACNAPNAAQVIEKSYLDYQAQAKTEVSDVLAWPQHTQQWLSTTRALEFNSITTVYLAYKGKGLSQAMLALNSSQTEPAQFVFDKAYLKGPKGVLAFVISASQSLDANNTELAALVLQQGQRVFPEHELSLLDVITEKKATFSCHVGHQRPSQNIGQNVWACGDYVHEKYPATLEAAVQTGQQVAQLIQAAVVQKSASQN